MDERSVVAGVAIAGTVLNGLSSFIAGLNGPNNVKDVSRHHLPLIDFYFISTFAIHRVILVPKY